MDSWQYILLALIQGLTEFMPISSSAHLLLPSMLLAWDYQGLAFDVAVHLGTLLAVLLYFRRDWMQMLLALKPGSGEPQWLGLLCVATLPLVLLGWWLGSQSWQQSLLMVGINTMVFGVLLGYADRRSRSPGAQQRALTTLSGREALYIGLAQALALFPGVSRTGIVLTVGLLLGLHPTAAARFALWLAAPAIVAANTYQLWKLGSGAEPVPWDLLLFGMLTAMLAAIMVLYALMRMLETVGLMPFVVYRVFVGLGLCLFLMLS